MDWKEVVVVDESTATAFCSVLCEEIDSQIFLQPCRTPHREHNNHGNPGFFRFIAKKVCTTCSRTNNNKFLPLTNFNKYSDESEKEMNTNFFIIKPTDALISQIYFVKKLYMFREVPLRCNAVRTRVYADPANTPKKLMTYQCRMCSGNLLMIGRGTARNM
jgi:DNA-directed RNA polymerase subunit RPC12/RpoP